MFKTEVVSDAKGFVPRPRTVVNVDSHVNPERYRNLVARVEEAEVTSSALPVLIFDLNESFMRDIGQNFAEGFGYAYDHSVSQDAPTMPHHDPKWRAQKHRLDLFDSPYGVVAVEFRMKGEDSLLEKVARNEHPMVNEWGRPGVEDVYGLTIVTRTPQQAHAAFELVNANPYAFGLYPGAFDESNFYEKPPTSGYEAIHASWRSAWGYDVEVHFVDEESHALNNSEDRYNPRSHLHLEERKVVMGHKLFRGGERYQVVMVRSSFDIAPDFIKEEIDITNRLPVTQGSIDANVLTSLYT